ncbi:aminotransferase-like domain-containing protein [Roseivivax sediminis]|uniref:DNA-binding transcriptional regulator, MocR family, contains an aminotransferase domain n=1 Tax=Roseivivax sediminis TaxID=936889 RepID=A0A1I1XP48_9RHOB|nr:PLP-dependent aminotransferase family protein [Roseivivax sediminis]SFE07320.1 DNA-binding transcriptional regulator, MocR family, contains an aminotransferase domain [Roseivivax sediminis]
MDTILSAYADEAGAGPKYRKVAEAIRRCIGAGTLETGDRLPPVRDLAWALKITPGTVARAYGLLTDEGTATGEVGRGTFVAARQRPAAPEREWPVPQVAPAEDTDRVALFGPSVPDMGQVALIHDALARLADRPHHNLLNYPSRTGYAPARAAVVRWLSGAALGPLEHEDLVLCHGGQSGVSLVMQTVLSGARPVVLVEELSYPGFRRAADLMRAEVVAVPMDAQGLVPEALDEIAVKHGAQLLCTSAEVHNPTGIVTPTSRREAIAEVARRRGLHVLEDDCYRLGPQAGPAYRALLPDTGWYVNSLSKGLTPALRVGFAVAPRDQAAGLRRSAEHGFFGLARPLADLVEDLLSRSETRRIMAAVRSEYGRYIRAAVNALGGFDVTWRPEIPFLWLKLPAGWRAASFVQAAEARGVQLRTAEDFAARDGFAPHAVRIAVNAQVPLEQFETAMGRLRALLDEPPERIAV